MTTGKTSRKQQKDSANRKQAFIDAENKYRPVTEDLQSRLDECIETGKAIDEVARKQIDGQQRQIDKLQERIAELEHENGVLRATNQQLKAGD